MDTSFIIIHLRTLFHCQIPPVTVFVTLVTLKIVADIVNPTTHLSGNITGLKTFVLRFCRQYDITIVRYDLCRVQSMSCTIYVQHSAITNLSSVRHLAGHCVLHIVDEWLPGAVALDNEVSTRISRTVDKAELFVCLWLILLVITSNASCSTGSTRPR